MEDIDIAKQCIDWNLDNFSKLYDKYIDKIYKFVFLKTSSKEVAEDITSDVFLSALNNIWKFKINDNSSVQAWLYKIANNKVIDFYKKNKETSEIWDYLEIWVIENFWENLDNKDKLKEVFEYLKSYKKEQREIFILRIWDDLSYNEISQITWQSVDNCKKIVSRTLKSINANFVILLLILIIK